MGATSAKAGARRDEGRRTPVVPPALATVIRKNLCNWGLQKSEWAGHPTQLSGIFERSLASIVASPRPLTTSPNAREQSPQTVADISSVTPEAEALASKLKSQGYRFVGPTSVYAFMQNVGAVNDHVRGCFRAVDYLPSSR